MTKRNRSTLLLGTSSAVAVMTLIAPAMAQVETKNDDNLEEIVIKGFRSSIENSIATKKGNSSIVEAISAEDIGKLPDVSIAESLARLPGLTTQRLEGRGQVLSIRGLAPDFSTTLLNGREQVTTGDNRGVEFDQYPAELLQAAVVYKTPDASLIGQGLAGTVDLRTIRPLDQSEQILSLNARYEFNEDKALNPDSSRHGFRTSATYVDQFADDTLGVAIGAAYQSTPTQNERFNAWGYPDDLGPRVLGGAKPFVQSNDLDRFGIIGAIEYEPSDNFSTSLDVYYSHFEEDQILRGIEIPLFWSAAQLQDGFRVDDGLIVEGAFENVTPVVRNDRNERNADLYAAGWNMRVGIFDDWAFETDISYSRSERDDFLLESYSGTGFALSGPTDTIGFEIQPNGNVLFSPGFDYTDTNLLVLTDPQGWGAGSRPDDPLVQAGFHNRPEIEDELTHLRFSVDGGLDFGPVSAVEIGVDLSRREKDKTVDERFIVLPNEAETAQIPEEALLNRNVSLDFIGIPGQVTYDPRFLLDNGFYELIPDLRPFVVTRNWAIEEDVVLSYVKFEVDSEVADIPVTGNFGTQIVYTDQESQGVGISGGDGGGEATLTEAVDGDKYWRFLPSINLNFDLGDEQFVRFGAARTLARARPDQLSVSQSFNTAFNLLSSTDPNRSFFSASGGNARLKPYIANAFDLSFEKYFARAGYVSLAGFYKDLQDFVNPSDAFLFDFADFVDATLSPEQQQQLGTTLGVISGPSNRGKGNIRGIEFTASVPLDLVSSYLDGFGTILSASYTDSKVTLGDDPAPITVPGLSKWVVNSTVYYEKQGFEARVSHRYRSRFLGEVAGLSATRILRTVKSESIFDAQIGYSFEQGPLAGVNVVLQARNLTDEPFVTFENDDGRQVIDRQSFGRTYLLGLTYTF